MKNRHYRVTRTAKESAGVIEKVIHGIQIHTSEAILTLGARKIAGSRPPGKASGEIRCHGTQPGKIKLADRHLRLKRPRLRHRNEGEVKIPAH